MLLPHVPPIEKVAAGAVKSPRVCTKPCTESELVPPAGVKAPELLFTASTQVRGVPEVIEYVWALVPFAVMVPVPPSAVEPMARLPAKLNFAL